MSEAHRLLPLRIVKPRGQSRELKLHKESRPKVGEDRFAKTEAWEALRGLWLLGGDLANHLGEPMAALPSRG